ncbi:MAG: beta-N-acetylglucosaminidase domain-containing protein, partial [Halioglobus sp.]|nr:beta-N-acetylglucosaminidase domain-containing protein [Halioglobus sp.]
MATVSGTRPFLCGIIEGFYGKPWSHASRLAYAPILSRAGLNTCLYCPKGDPWLRRQWQERWPQQQWQELQELSKAYAAAGVAWGVGLSPFALYQRYGAHQRQQLRDKVGQLEALGAPILAVLFDDMPGDVDALADRQAEIVSDIAAWLPQTRLMMCPTYYSFDPVLERHFGTMPAGYWARLGTLVPAAVDVFWTGNTVCSATIEAHDIQRANE